MFGRTIGIDYSGADTPITRTSKLQVYSADGNDQPQQVPPEEPRLRRWHRRGIAEWLVNQLANADTPTLVGIDHAFSFPINYFQEYDLVGQGWAHLLCDFREYWPTDGDNARVSEIHKGTGQARSGNATWRQVTYLLSGTAKSPFLFGVPGAVAHSTHAGLPWLRYIRRQLGDRVHFWLFDGDGWDPPPSKSVISEVYPALWNRRFRREQGISEDEHDAYSITAWLAHADRSGWLPEYFNPNLSQAEEAQAREEGWILGVLGYIDL